MCFPDFPFDVELPSFPHHSDVLSYLHQYADRYNLHRFIQFNCSVESVTPIQVCSCSGDHTNKENGYTVHVNHTKGVSWKRGRADYLKEWWSGLLRWWIWRQERGHQRCLILYCCAAGMSLDYRPVAMIRCHKIGNFRISPYMDTPPPPSWYTTSILAYGRLH